MGNYKSGLETRNHIYSCAKELFITKGFTETTVRDIADNANVKVGLINYYFESKDALGCAVYKELTRHIDVCVEKSYDFDPVTTKKSYMEYQIFSYMLYLEFFHQLPEAARLYTALCRTSKFPQALMQIIEFYLSDVMNLDIPDIYNPKLNDTTYFDIIHSILCGMEIQFMEDLLNNRLNQPYPQAIDTFINIYYQYLFDDADLLAELVASCRKKFADIRYRFDENYDVVIENIS